MASLLRKMFDTMPLKGVLGAVSKLRGAPEPATLGQMMRHVNGVPHRADAHGRPHQRVPAAGTAEECVDLGLAGGGRPEPGHADHLPRP